MPCYNPLVGFRARRKNASGKRSIVFNRQDGFADMPVSLPCGQCVGCRLAKSREWAVRCMHEASLWPRNCFVTLTYRDEELPRGFGDCVSLDPRDAVLFMKRLRKEFAPETIRSFGCMEYGARFGRPHFHLLLFNLWFPDAQLWSEKRGTKLFRSDVLDELWGKGHALFGDVTFESAAYVARYVMKKHTGEKALPIYNDIDWRSGEIRAERVPEGTVCVSRRPGVGRGYLDQFSSDIYPRDFVVAGRDFDVKVRPPRYYDSVFELASPEVFRRVVRKRRKMALAASLDNGPGRLATREYCEEVRAKQLIRGYEHAD